MVSGYTAKRMPARPADGVLEIFIEPARSARKGGNMNSTMKKWTIGFLVMGISFCFAAMSVPAQEKMDAKEIRKHQKEGRDEARDAVKAFREIMNAPDKGIPRELLDKAEAIGIFTNVVKAGFIFGGRGGDGLVSRRTGTGWSPPVFYNVGGASFGAQIGAKKTDYIMLFMNEGALRDLLDDKLEFEGDLSFAAGPVGRTVGAGTNLTLDAGILVYSRSQGAFVGASIGGAVLTADNNVNEAIYNMKAGAILDNPSSVSNIALPKELQSVNSVLSAYSKR